MACRLSRSCISSLALLAASLCAGGALGAADAANGRQSAIPFKRAEEPLSAGTLMRVGLGLGVAIAVGVGALYLVRRYLPRSLGQSVGGERRIRLLEARRLTPKLTLLLVEVDGRPVLLSQSSERVDVLQLDTRREAEHAPGA